MKYVIILLILIGFVTSIVYANHIPEHPQSMGVISANQTMYKIHEKPPLLQYKYGISYNNVQCHDILLKIQKYNGSPACVTYHTGIKLLERGWATCDDEISYGRGHPCGVRSSPGISSDNT